MSKDDFISIFQIPSQDGGETAGVFVSLIDASGSMRPFWESLATLFNEYTPKENSHLITFSGTAKKCSTTRLSTKLSDHGGGLTNIPAAFEELDKIIASVNEETPITVLFVSDGQDNNLKTLPERLNKLRGCQDRKITFLCLGIQSAFPTFLSMSLRELYHSTRSSIPALFLIEYYTTAALKNKFEAMKEYFQLRKKIKVSPSIKEFPWSFEESEELYEGTWVVITSKEFNGHTLTVGEKQYDLTKYPPTIDLVLDVFRAYVQEIQMISLTDKEFLIEQAGEALRIMQILIDYFIEHEGIDLKQEFKQIGTLDTNEINEEVDKLMKLNFNKRVEFNKLRHNQFRIKGYFENIELLANGLGVEQLNEWEAAKRIGIGTITGNYYQRSLNLYGLTVEKFKILRNEFLEIYQNNPINSNIPSDQEESIITLENQKDIFLDPEFSNGLRSCASQFDLVETFPVVGLALHIRRPSDMDKNPWVLEVKSIAKHNKQMDSFSLLKSDFRMSLSTGNNETEIINAVLPLFTLKDGDMQPLLSHGIFNLLMTFVVQRNVDTLDPFCYLSLLGNTWIYLLSHFPNSEYREDLFQRILETIQLIYGQNECSNSFKNTLVSLPEKTIFSDENDLSKIICYILLLFYSKSLDEEEIKNLLFLAMIRFFKLTRSNDSWQGLVTTSISLDSVIDEIKEKTKKEFSNFSTLGQLSSRYSEISTQTLSNSSNTIKDTPLTLKRAKFDSKNDKINLSTFISLFSIILNREPKEEELLQFLYLSSFKSSGNNFFTDLLHHKTPNDFVNEMQDCIIKNPDVMFSALNADTLQDLKQQFISKFQSDHVQILPLSAGKIIEFCKVKNISPKSLEYDASSNMVRNACMASSCPFFLNPDIDISKHLGTWQDKCPRAFHKLIKTNSHASPSVLLQKMEQGEGQCHPQVKKPVSEYYPSEESIAIDYITQVKLAYEKISEEGENQDDINAMSVYVPRKNQWLSGKERRQNRRARLGKPPKRSRGRGRGKRGRR